MIFSARIWGFTLAIGRGANRVMDVEDVLSWAYGDELSKRRDAVASNLARNDASLVGKWTSPAGFPSVSPMFAGFHGGSSSSTAGSSWDRGPLSPRSAGPPHADALKVETAVSLLADALAGLQAPDHLALDIGLPVDIDGAFAAALANVANIIIVHASRGGRPSVGRELPRPAPVHAANGKPAIRCEVTILDIARRPYASERPAGRLRSGFYETGAFCPLEWDPDPQWIVNERAEYSVWRIALEQLVVQLAGELATISMLAPSAPIAPWLGERDAGKPPNLFAPGAPGVYTRLEVLSMEARRGQRRRPPARRQDLHRPARPGRSIAKAPG